MNNIKYIFVLNQQLLGYNLESSYSYIKFISPFLFIHSNFNIFDLL